MGLFNESGRREGAGREGGGRHEGAGRGEGGGRDEGGRREDTSCECGGRHGKSRGGSPSQLLADKLSGKKDAQLVFIGSVNCLRHKPYMGIGELMRQKKASVLCPSMSDFSTGRYLRQIEEAILELSAERNTKEFVLVTGCQWVILSTDGDMIIKNLKREHDINLTISVDDHLEFGDHE